MTGNLLRVVDFQARIGAREKAHGAARAAARFVGGHVPEIGAGMVFLGGAALLAGALAPREKARALPSAVGTPKKPDGLSESEHVTPLSVEEPPSSPLTAPEYGDDSDTEQLVKREREEAQKSLLHKEGADKGSAEVAVSEQEVPNAAPEDAQLPAHTDGPPKAKAKANERGMRTHSRRRKLKVIRKTQNLPVPQTPDGPWASETTAPKADAPLVIHADTANDDLLDEPEPAAEPTTEPTTEPAPKPAAEPAAEPAPKAAKNVGAKGQEAARAELRRMRKMITRDLLVTTASARQFCARSRVHDLCDIFLLNDGIDPGSAGLILGSLRNYSYGSLTPAQEAYLDSVLNDRTMNAKIPGHVTISALVSGLGADLVHAQYGHVEVWDVRECTSLLGAFRGSSIKSRLDLSFWDTRKVTDAYAAFSGTSFDVDVSTWDVSNVDEMSSMFYKATGFEGDVSEWDVSNVRKMTLMFSGASMFNGDVSRWDVGRVELMDMMFLNTTSFNGDLSHWNVRNVTSMSRMFEGATSFMGGGVEKWESRVGVDVTDMFRWAPNVDKEALEWAAQRTKPAYGRARRRGFV